MSLLFMTRLLIAKPVVLTGIESLKKDLVQQEIKSFYLTTTCPVIHG
jgi:hypothetical protein